MVGITGLLNSGKSSLLASYLSPSGRQRVLRGTANNQGTHRFVLWLPQAWWSVPEQLNVLREYLTRLFGHAPEDLAENMDTAFAQYNGRLLHADGKNVDPLHVPLITSDPSLDRLGLALLDCPDIQTAFTQQSGEPALAVASGASSTLDSTTDAEQVQRQRREQLSKIGRLCSAFIVVTRLSSLHDSTLLSILETLRDTMPGVRRLLAVNKVKARYSPDVVDEQAAPIVAQFQIDNVYMAYDYRSHWAEQRLPPKPVGMDMPADDPLPIFFRAGKSLKNAVKEPQTGLPHATSDDELDSGSYVHLRPPVVESYLLDLAQLLRPGALIVESRRSVCDQLQRKSSEALDWFAANQSRRSQLLHDAWQTVAQACYAFMAQRDSSGQAVSLRLQTSPAIVAQMSDSLVRAAPWSMRPSLAIDRSVRHLQSSIAGGMRRIRWLQSASSGLSQFIGSFRHGQTGTVVTADRFRDQIERHDRTGVLTRRPAEQLKLACEQSLSRFQQEDTARLDDAWLDNWSREIWKHMSLKKKLYVGMMPLAPIFGPLLAVTLIPFDGGGTAVLVFATTKELLLAAGIAAVALPATAGGEVQDIVESETALSQLGELFAVTCDSLGLPRPGVHEMPRIKLAGIERQLNSSQLAFKSPTANQSLPSWQLAPGLAQSLAESMQQLRREIDGTSI